MKIIRKIFALAVIGALFLTSSALSQKQYTYAQNTGRPFGRLYAFNKVLSSQPFTNTDSVTQNLIDQVSPAVVSIYGYKKVITTDSVASSLFYRFFINDSLSPIHNTVQDVEISAGSGFFVDPNGYILTNNHVVSDPQINYEVDLSNGEKATADIIYRDPVMDLAVLKIPGQNFPTLQLSDSSQIKKGEQIYSMGNAFGMISDLVSEGKIVDLHQTIMASDGDNNKPMSDMIQTDAQLYPGDSGGPTFNQNGEVVGVNVAMAVDVENVSFSIPINYAKQAIAQAIGNQ